MPEINFEIKSLRTVSCSIIANSFRSSKSAVLFYTFGFIIYALICVGGAGGASPHHPPPPTSFPLVTFYEVKILDAYCLLMALARQPCFRAELLNVYIYIYFFPTRETHFIFICLGAVGGHDL